MRCNIRMIRLIKESLCRRASTVISGDISGEEFYTGKFHFRSLTAQIHAISNLQDFRLRGVPLCTLTSLCLPAAAHFRPSRWSGLRFEFMRVELSTCGLVPSTSGSKRPWLTHRTRRSVSGDISGQ